MQSGYSYLSQYTGGVLNDFDTSVITNLYDSEVTLLSPLVVSQIKSDSDESTKVDYDKEPDYTGRTVTVTTNLYIVTVYHNLIHQFDNPLIRKKTIFLTIIIPL